ncbi:hypothetical protein CAEBREN_20001 [Caenorhabditis brenneri]|uniref:Uncharacterized protein n=1 Tax=Caenorhabditis brenneri TaxID=135651 RepID=G0PIE8_CAEBE|nr:hypothetical protein CAEBREN_20001 [Caenorhabditis brenneri]
MNLLMTQKNPGKDSGDRAVEEENRRCEKSQRKLDQSGDIVYLGLLESGERRRIPREEKENKTRRRRRRDQPVLREEIQPALCQGDQQGGQKAFYH